MKRFAYKFLWLGIMVQIFLLIFQPGGGFATVYFVSVAKWITKFCEGAREHTAWCVPDGFNPFSIFLILSTFWLQFALFPAIGFLIDLFVMKSRKKEEAL